MERKVRDSCGKSVSRGDPAGASRGGFPTAESECLKWKSTSEFLHLVFNNFKKKTVR
ncbi:hypothetical protein KEH51_03950 [[Brevibacterium] frigoritolerans]|uniref:Uncharacterized protein n=1 Tax=Peribacillus frigoritolerans TaxID=450367 RepID=A0A941J236_9BACI|nr:hypothetical protein [Peribacillus frigoritolerans]